MEIMKKVLYTGIFIILMSSGVQAQNMFGINYNIGLPTGSTNDFIGKPSFRGFGIDYRAFLTDYVSIGVSGDWQVFYEELPAQTWEDGTRTTYGKQYRYINTFPILLNGHYYFNEIGNPRFYIGAGIGATVVDQRTDVGLYSIEPDDTWRFGFAPEIGLLLPLGYTTSFNISARYQYALKSGDSDAMSYLLIKVGFSFLN